MDRRTPIIRLAVDVARRLETPTSPISNRRGSEVWAVNQSLTLVGEESCPESFSSGRKPVRVMNLPAIPIAAVSTDEDWMEVYWKGPPPVLSLGLVCPCS